MVSFLLRLPGMGPVIGWLMFFVSAACVVAPASASTHALVTSSLPHVQGSDVVVSTLDRVMLESAAGMSAVRLPHVLGPADFRSDGSTVLYWFEVRLPELPQVPLGIYINKVSLAGQIYLNGEWVGSCRVGELDAMRCLHRPWLQPVPKALWKEGRNLIAIEVYADARQANGLSRIQIGPLTALEEGDYSVQQFVRVTLLQALFWITLILGVLSLMVAAFLPERSLYLWVGVASLMHALSSVNFLATSSWTSPQLYGWFAFSSRVSSTPLLMMACIAFYGKDRPWQRNLALAYAMLGPVLLWLTGSSRTVTVLLYLPILLCGALLVPAMARWTWTSRRILHVLMLLAALSMLMAGYGDWHRLRGSSAFEGIYLMAYASLGFLVIMGSLVMAELATGLIQSRKLSAALTRQVAEREALLQDMHDGFGSQLMSARILAEQGHLDQRQLGDLLGECMSDLYLVVDTLSGPGKTLDLALGDFRFRTDRRTSGMAVQIHWHQSLEGLPLLTDREVLQILRILQEAVTNSLKHSRASNIWVDVAYLSEKQRLRLEVVDDGVGMPDKPKLGRGLQNMKQRARELCGSLQWSNRSPGTSVVLELPVKPS